MLEVYLFTYMLKSVYSRKSSQQHEERRTGYTWPGFDPLA